MRNLSYSLLALSLIGCLIPKDQSIVYSASSIIIEYKKCKNQFKLFCKMATIKSIFNSGIPSTSSDSLISIQRVLHSTWRIWIANIGRHTAIHQYIVVVCTTLYPPSRKPYHPLLRIRAMQSSSSRLAIVSCRNPNIYPGD